MMEIDFRALLRADSALTAIVSTRIYWRARPVTSPLPALVIYKTGADTDQTYSGPSAARETRVQINALASDAGTAASLADRLRVLLDHHREIRGSTNFMGIFFDNARDLDAPGTGDAERIYICASDFNIKHKDT